MDFDRSRKREEKANHDRKYNNALSFENEKFCGFNVRNFGKSWKKAIKTCRNSTKTCIEQGFKTKNK